MSQKYEEVIFNNGDITKRLNIFYTVKETDVDKFITSLITCLNKQHSSEFELYDYGEGYLAFKDINNNIIYLEPI